MGSEAYKILLGDTLRMVCKEQWSSVTSYKGGKSQTEKEQDRRKKHCEIDVLTTVGLLRMILQRRGF